MIKIIIEYFINRSNGIANWSKWSAATVSARFQWRRTDGNMPSMCRHDRYFQQKGTTCCQMSSMPRGDGELIYTNSNWISNLISFFFLWHISFRLFFIICSQFEMRHLVKNMYDVHVIVCWFVRVHRNESHVRGQTVSVS